MPLPNGYTLKSGAIRSYFDAIQNAEAPDRFSQKFLAGLGFSSSNDRLLIGILKELSLLNQDGAPTERYYSFLDKSNSEKVIAEGVREAFSDLFNVNKSAHELSLDDAYNKLRTLYRGEKKDTVIKLIAKTFVSLCEYADFEGTITEIKKSSHEQSSKSADDDIPQNKSDESDSSDKLSSKNIELSSLQYHINIVLPDTRDQAVYDAIFKSLRHHLG